MIVLNTKDFDELQEESLSELSALGFSSSRGSIARLFLSIINDRIATAYRALTVNHIRAFLSSSDGAALDAIGELLNCERLDVTEDDETFKYRISQQCLVLASSNFTAVELAALSVDGVDNVKLKPYGMGAGTYVVIVEPETDTELTTEEIINNVTLSVAETNGYGIKFKVVTPTYTRVKLSFKIYLTDRLSDTEAQEIKYDVQEALYNYFNELAIGEDIMIDKITETIMQVSDYIKSHQNIRFLIDNENALYVNQSCRWFEKFAISNDEDAIIIS